MGWHGCVGLDGPVVDVQAFGTSAPLQDPKNRFGLTRRPSLASPSSSWPTGTAAPAGRWCDLPAGSAGTVRPGQPVKRVRAEW
jgi:hypothetical protein